MFYSLGSSVSILKKKTRNLHNLPSKLTLSPWISVTVFMEPFPPKPLDQSKNITVRTFHIWPGRGHLYEHIFLAPGVPAAKSSIAR